MQNCPYLRTTVLDQPRLEPQQGLRGEWRIAPNQYLSWIALAHLCSCQTALQGLEWLPITSQPLNGRYLVPPGANLGLLTLKPFGGRLTCWKGKVIGASPLWFSSGSQIYGVRPAPSPSSCGSFHGRVSPFSPYACLLANPLIISKSSWSLWEMSHKPTGERMVLSSAVGPIEENVQEMGLGARGDSRVCLSTVLYHSSLLG